MKYNKKLFKKPYKKYAKKTFKKYGLVTIPKAVKGLPTRLRTTLRYCSLLNMGNGSSSYVSHTFRANDCYDPDYSSTGHQPLYFDQYSPIYDNYVVNASRISATFSNLSGSGAGVSNPMIVGVDVSNDVTGLTDATTIIERQTSKYGLMTVQKPSTRINAAWSRKRAFPNDTVNSSGSMTTTIASDATGYYRVYATGGSVGTAIASDSLSCIVVIEYDVEFFNLTNIGPS